MMIFLWAERSSEGRLLRNLAVYPDVFCLAIPRPGADHPSDTAPHHVDYIRL